MIAIWCFNAASVSFRETCPIEYPLCGVVTSAVSGSEGGWAEGFDAEAGFDVDADSEGGFGAEVGLEGSFDADADAGLDADADEGLDKGFDA